MRSSGTIAARHRRVASAAGRRGRRGGELLERAPRGCGSPVARAWRTASREFSRRRACAPSSASGSPAAGARSAGVDPRPVPRAAAPARDRAGTSQSR